MTARTVLLTLPMQVKSCALHSQIVTRASNAIFADHSVYFQNPNAIPYFKNYRYLRNRDFMLYPAMPLDTTMALSPLPLATD